MKKLLLLLLPFYFFLLPSQVSAQIRLTYPIPDLGYCRDAKECYLYCEIPENKAACWSYGKYKVGNDVLGVTTMDADEKRMMEEKARQYNITFPIADLGNCAGPQECRDFCETPSNQQTCMDFAKKKGFHKEAERSDGMDPNKRDELLTKAKTELGCTSRESCSNICETNPGRCEAFAKKHGAYREPPQSSGRYSAEEKMKLMQKAQGDLGCTSMESCKSVCEKNPQRCMEFAKKHGFDKEDREPPEQQEQYENREYQQGASSGTSPNYGIQRFGKGGCDSEESCKTYCQEHPDECPGFQGFTKATEGSGQPSPSLLQKTQGSYVGPSGCRNEAECKSWCTDHPDACPGFKEGKTREENAKREYESRKKEMEKNLEIQKREFEQNRETMQKNYEYRPPTTSTGGREDGIQHYPPTESQPSYQPQPSSGSYAPSTPPPTAP